MKVCCASDVSGSPPSGQTIHGDTCCYSPRLSTDIAQEKADDDAQCSTHAAGQATSQHRQRSITPSAATDFPQDADYSGKHPRAGALKWRASAAVKPVIWTPRRRHATEPRPRQGRAPAFRRIDAAPPPAPAFPLPSWNKHNRQSGF